MSRDSLTAALTGRYTIDREIGAGGMATVFLAHDVRHDRKVALKVLRPELSAVLGVERFLAEIKTTANLQHPHILSLFDSGEADGTVFYVMPYVDGETLRDRLKREHQLPVDEAVRIACEVADALDYAHQHGIVHRDIKPENILLHGGHAMVADFGIALAASRSDSGQRMTETGMSLGTPNYMSPEQAMGDREITPKADIYALGCVLYEMLCAEPPFTGPNAQAVFARILTDEPRSLTLQRKTIPAHLEAAVGRALQKLPADRFSSAARFAEALRQPELGATSSASPARAAANRGASPPARPEWARRPMTFAIAAAAVVGALGLVAGLRLARPEPVALREVRFTLALTDSAKYVDTYGRSIAVSPDGSAIVYPGGTLGRRQLFLRRLNDPRPTPIAGTEDGYMPFFSPTGDWVGFVANQRLFKVRLSGGLPIAVTQLFGNTVAGATWGSHDDIVLEDITGLSRVGAAGGGKLTQLVPTDSVTTLLEWPTFLSTGDAVLCAATRRGTTFLGVVTLADGHLTVFEDIEGTDPRVLESGWVGWTSSEGVVLAAQFDERRRKFTGPPTQVLSGVIVDGNAAKIAMGPGVLAQVEGGARGARLLRLDRRGVAKAERPEELSYSWPRLSPDGRKIAVVLEDRGGGGNVWVLDRASGTRQRLTLDRDAVSAEWSRDGRRLAFGYFASNSWDVYVAPADGSGRADSLVFTAQTEMPFGWAPSGEFVFYRQTQNRGDIYYLDAKRAEHAFAATPADETAATLSPDGHWLAYLSDHSGRREVYVRPFPAGDGRWQVSADGGVEPRWTKNGREVIYRQGELFLAVPVTPGAGFSVGKVDTLFRGPYETNRARARYDVSRDGSEFILVGAGAEDRSITVWLNPFAELRLKGRASATRQ